MNDIVESLMRQVKVATDFKWLLKAIVGADSKLTGARKHLVLLPVLDQTVLWHASVG